MHENTGNMFGSLSYIVCFLSASLIRGQTESFNGGQCVSNSNDIVLYNIVYQGCIDQCRARETCIAITVRRKTKVCRLHSYIDDSRPLKRCPGHLLSQKKFWKKKGLVGCPACGVGKTCSTDTGGDKICVYKECTTPVENILYGDVLGNGIKAVGTQISYSCHPDFRNLGGDKFRKCGSDGEWNGTSAICGKHAFRLPLKSAQPDFDHVDLLANEISLLDRSSFIFRVKAKNNAHVLLKNDLNPSSFIYWNDYEIVIGGAGNTESTIGRGEHGTTLTTYQEKGIVSDTSFRTFWISKTSFLKVGKGTVVNEDEILSWLDPFVSINYIKIGVGHGSDAVFLFP